MKIDWHVIEPKTYHEGCLVGLDALGDPVHVEEVKAVVHETVGVLKLKQKVLKALQRATFVHK